MVETVPGFVPPGRDRTAGAGSGSSQTPLITTTIFLLDGAKRILPSFAELLSKKAAERLAKLGVQVITGAMVESIDARGVTVGGKLIPCGAVLWTAGVSPSPLVKMLGVATDRAGRACVGPFLSVPDTPNVARDAHHVENFASTAFRNLMRCSSFV